MRKSLGIILAVSVALVFSSCKKESTADTTTPPVTPPVVVPPVVTINDNDNMLMGNPSNAKTVADSINNYLMVKGAYTLSYNSSRGIPNWVSWHLFQNDLGSLNRQEEFLSDTDLPWGFKVVRTENYNGSGFDRGHNCPSGDRTLDNAKNVETFLLTNIIPQAPLQNQGPWATMESYIRSQLSTTKEAYIIMGTYGEGGVGSKSPDVVKTINSGTITVPSNIWKVVVLMANGNNDTTRVDASTRVISVNMPNRNDLGGANWKDYRTSVDAIEAITGYDLLSRLPVAVQAAIEAKIDDK